MTPVLLLVFGWNCRLGAFYFKKLDDVMNTLGFMSTDPGVKPLSSKKK
jgi:hypothetical protein